MAIELKMPALSPTMEQGTLAKWLKQEGDRIEPGDLEEGLAAASAIGDDTLQRGAGQRINPESFTHGTSRQRMAALRLGLESKDDTACEVFFEGA